MKNVLILGAYGQNNLGDEALLSVFLEMFHDAHIVVNSARPSLTRQHYGVTTVRTYRGWPRFSRLRAIAGADLIVFGGGSLLKEIEGSTAVRLLYFARLVGILSFARLCGRPTAMLGVGVGPLSRQPYIWLARLAARLTTLICVRDTASQSLLQSIVGNRQIYVTADTVLTLPAPSPTDMAAPGATSPQPYIVVIPRYSLTDEEQSLLAAACDHMIATNGVEIVFVPFQSGYLPRFDDTPVCEAIRAKLRRPEVSCVWVTEEPLDALAWISRAQLVVSTRLHGLIFAAICDVASVAISYEPKVAAFMAESGQSAATVTLAQHDLQRLPQVVDCTWRQRTVISLSVRERVAELRARAQLNADLARELLQQRPTGGLLTGTVLLFASMTVVNAGNYLFNLVLGRWLGPTAFADLSLIVTMMLVVTLLTATLQTVAAKFAAMYMAAGSVERISSARMWLVRAAWLIGVAVGGALILSAPLLRQYFHSASTVPFVVLGIGIPLYLSQGVDRGVLQGQTRFGLLSLSYQAEMWVRLLGAIILVALGLALNGAVAALTLSFAATWLIARRVRTGLPNADRLTDRDRRDVVAFASPVIAALAGQVIINNSDIFIVKHFFNPVPAGHYAALALTGRIVFFATWSMVTAMFPIVAQKHTLGLPHRHLLYVSLTLVSALSACIILAMLGVPTFVVNVLFGSAYVSIAPLLWLYALATTLYALSNVVITYRLSLGQGAGSGVALLGGILQVIGLVIYHDSLREVVLVQVVIMGSLLILVMLWDGALWRRERALAPVLIRGL